MNGSDIHNPLKLDYQTCLTNAFAGTKPISLRYLHVGCISTHQAEQLRIIGIQIEPHTHRINGLSTTRLTSGKTVDVVSFKRALDNCIDTLNPDTKHLIASLILELDTLRHELSVKIDTMTVTYLSRLLADQREIFAYICLLTLPDSFLAEVKDIGDFTVRTAPLLGRYVLAYIKETQCSTAP